MITKNMPWADYCGLRLMNGSTLVSGCKSMRRLKRAIDGGYPEETNAMRKGTGLHTLTLEPEQFEDRFCVMPDFHLDSANMTKAKNKSQSDEDRRTESKLTNYYKDRVREFGQANPGKSFLSRTDYDSILYAIEAMRSRPAICRLLDGASCEVTMTGFIAGVEFKGRLDVLRQRVIADIKSTTDVSPRSFGRVFANLHYGEKLSIYRELIRKEWGEICDVKIVAQEVTGDYDNCLISVPGIVLDNAFTRVLKLIDDYKRCLDSGVWPGVDRGADEVELYVPNWSMEDAGEELVEFSSDPIVASDNEVAF